MKYSAFMATIVTLLAQILPSTSLANPASGEDRLQNLTSWSEASVVSKQLNAPIVLLIEQRHCGFCQRLKREVFRPMANDSSYFDRVIFASVLIDYDGPLIEVDGEMLSGFEFAETFDANTTPTVLFLDHASTELQSRMLGYISGPQYSKNFIGKLDNAIESMSANE